MRYVSFIALSRIVFRGRRVSSLHLLWLYSVCNRMEKWQDRGTQTIVNCTDVMQTKTQMLKNSPKSCLSGPWFCIGKAFLVNHYMLCCGRRLHADQGSSIKWNCRGLYRITLCCLFCCLQWSPTIGLWTQSKGSISTSRDGHPLFCRSAV